MFLEERPSLPLFWDAIVGEFPTTKVTRHPWLFLARGWYGALGRVVNFEMCHLRSLGRVAIFKNEAFRNGV